MNLADVEFAILETNGEITVILKPEKRGVVVEDLNINPSYEGITYDLVVDSKVMHTNLKKIGKNYKWLENKLKAFNTKPEGVLIATIDGKDQIFCQKKGEKI